jgi:5-methylcytosine-specific restriction endonuclease McrA
MSRGLSAAMQSNVLALNRLYLAIHVVSVRRAFCLLWKGMAEVINVEDGAYMAYDFESWREISELKLEFSENGEADEWILAVNFQIQVPRVIRLLDYDRVPRSSVKFSRRNIFLRDENCCQYCTRKFSAHNLSLDHVLPRSRGGQTSWENVVCACLKCNVRKGGRTPQEAGMKLQQKPVKPKRNPMLVHQLSSQKYACWRSFLP